MKVDETKLKEILLRENYVSEKDLKQAVEWANAHRAPISDYLLTKELITPDLLGQALAEFYGVGYADLNSNPASPQQVLKIPPEVAKQLRVVIFKEDGNIVNIATDDPSNPIILQSLTASFPSRKIVLSYSLPEDIDASFVHYRKPLETRFTEIIKSQKSVAPELLDEIISDALALGASDIHFEPQEKEVLIRFRIDGVLHEAGRISRDYHENIINRVKVQAHLRLDDHFSAQDGAIRYHKDKTVVDLRVSIAPTLDGEKIVMRILSEYVRGFVLSDLGLLENDQKIITVASEKPFGMILITGPTGSGKTTTVYALIKILNDPESNITTIEDPVEYKVPGVNHIQVNLATNLTFAKGLRSIVRQDPDIILVGEIRDSETAEIAVNAALTGHLLFSTFHANDAATAIPRLLDMGIEPFLLSSTLELIVAQRLVRRICESCRVSELSKEENLKKYLVNPGQYFTTKTTTLYHGKGCPKCSMTGYKGRIAIFELIQLSPQMRELILTNPSTKQIWDLARKQGSRSLFEDGIEKVKTGATTLEELLRVATPPAY
jgi:type IV pilus assembly protein PilB